MTRAVLAAACVAAWAAPARADGFLHELAHQAEARLDAAIAARAPALVPPVAIAVHWKAQKLGAIDLGATLVALAAADLDGDGRGELYAITPREVVVLGERARGGGGVREFGRVPFGGERAVPAPRDPVGTAVVDGTALIAVVSTWQRGVRIQLDGTRVIGAPDAALGFPVCAQRLQLAPGRNYFVDAGGELYGGRCRDVVDAAGRSVHAAAMLATTGKLAVTVGSERRDLAGVGVAFDVADIDRDGVPEIIYAGAGAPGDADAVKVVTFGADERKPLFRRAFNAGVAGVVAVDLDGDGALEVVVAVRLVGSTKIDLWRLD